MAADSAADSSSAEAAVPATSERTESVAGTRTDDTAVTWKTWVAIGALLLAALVGIAAFVTSRKRAAGQNRGATPPMNQGDPSRAGRSPDSSYPPPMPKPAEPVATQAALDALAARVARLERQAEDVAPAPRSAQIHVAPPESAVPPTASALPSEATAVAAAFVSWCHSGGGLMDRHELFQTRLDEALPGAVVEVVKRDRDSPARPIAFDGSGGNSAVAYWLVRAGGELMLFPQPQGPQQFRDLAPVFAGTVTPQTVSSVEPARVSASGSGYVLTQPGRIA